MPTARDVHHCAVQTLRTDRLMGVDFVPRRVANALLDAISHVADFPAASAMSESVDAATRSGVPTLSSSGSSSGGPSVGAPKRGPSDEATPLVGLASAPDRSGPDRAGAGEAELGKTGPKAELLASLRDRHDRECPHCTVATAHTQTVFGEGNPDAELMFVGEAPGETEDRLGRPFVGRAGQKLDEIIVSMGLTREAVYIANVLKSRPPDNRTPVRQEVEACGPYLREQIRVIRPSVIVTLGGPAAKLLLGVETGITRLRGVWSSYVDGELIIPVMPTFHPAYLLRNYTPQTRRQVWSDMQEVCRRLRGE